MKKTLQIKNYPEQEMKKLKKACIDKNCEYVHIVVPAVTEYLKQMSKK